MRTYGKVAYDQAENMWNLKVEPHISIKMKRLFGKIASQIVGVLALTATPENCRDLLWFMDRYPLETAADDLRRMKRGSKAYDEKILTLEKILSGEYKSERYEMALPLREYQYIPAQIVWKNEFLLCSDEVGIGKTFEAIYALSNPDTRPAMVVTMAHLPRQWQDEFEKFAPDVRTHILKSGIPYELADKKSGLLPDVIITNYHKLRGWATVLSGMVRSVVFDECQELRRNESAKYTAAVTIARACKYRLGLSATPTTNYGGEIWNVIDVLQEDALGARDEFEREFVRPNLWNELGSHLRESGIMLRRTKKDVGRELPIVTQVPHTIDCDAKILDSIQGSAAALARMILKESPAMDKGEYFRAHGEFDMVMRRTTGISKAPYVADFVKILVESGEKVVVFGWHHAVYDIWRDRLKEFNPVFFTGEETPSQKEASKKSFVEGDAKILIISLRAGAGLDGLQHACRVCVFGELDWSEGVIKQCIGRISRDGQPDAVTAYFMLSETGADPVMCDVLEIKGQQGHAIRDPFSDLVVKTANSADHVKKMAAHYLRSIGAPEEASHFEEETISA